jgi:hypothetical protein
VGFSDRLRSWLKGDSKRGAPSKSTDKASRTSTKELEEFVDSRAGVEAFLEPKTAIYSTTLLLIAHDGEYLRRPVKDTRQAGEFCKDVNIPLYDAAKVGYPKRMRDYEQGRGPRKVDISELPPWPGDEDPAAPGPASPAPEAPSPGSPASDERGHDEPGRDEPGEPGDDGTDAPGGDGDAGGPPRDGPPPPPTRN